jgi:hypothetical protein
MQVRISDFDIDSIEKRDGKGMRGGVADLGER